MGQDPDDDGQFLDDWCWYKREGVMADSGNYTCIVLEKDDVLAEISGEEFQTLVRVRFVCGDRWANPKTLSLADIAKLTRRNPATLRRHLRVLVDAGHLDAYKRMPWIPRKYSYQVYFIQPVDGGPVKIGKSEDPRKRLREIQTGHPAKLQIVGLIDGDESLERELHRKFAHLRLEGEWFALENDLLEYINEINRESHDNG